MKTVKISQAFPCFDEPSFKSSFTTSLVRPSDGYIGKEENGSMLYMVVSSRLSSH
jgi:hypothetical protein